MRLSGLTIDFEQLAAPLPVLYGAVNAEDWLAVPMTLVKSGGRLVSIWGTECGDGEPGQYAICAAYAAREGLLWIELPLAGRTTYPDLTPLFPCANRMQRAVADLLGIAAQDASDQRSWLNHGAWSPAHFPLRQKSSGDAIASDRQPGDYPFVRVEGDGVHEIPVGPVHAGIIEPGHFRFSIVGEKVLRLEQRLGYTHKGIDKRFEQLAPMEAHRLAGRVSGDSTVAFAWAYCMALESAAGCKISARGAWLRALMLERERVANHLGDLGALGNDASFSFGLAQFSRLREDWLRTSAAIFGHRLMMDCVVPGGVATDIDRAAIDLIDQQCDAVEREVQILRNIYDEHAGLQDRFITTGRVQPALAAQLGLTGLAGRASGQAADLRSDHPFPPYDALEVKMATHRNGDVAARVTVRFEETIESLRLIRALCKGLPGGAVMTELELPATGSRGAGWVEGWRGEVLVILELEADANGSHIRRCHCHDPSWQNWPVLEHAVIGNIVPDFPLINKSFNLSYSGHDL
ncbi:MAG TPA: NADH-quinone oxidoreductase subunit C [Burkholderiales bacterium]|nr:NADH-quinone oxidoreductase subunit C [Burkholderiales bacterium]